MKTDKEKVLENILWSIALPGFPQLLNGQYLKGFGFIALEIIINVQAKFNYAILLSFLGEIKQALEVTNFQWLMFYPCIYLFGMWDAYRDAGGGKEPFSFLPFVFSAYFGTVGVVYSKNLTLVGLLFGPVWLSILFLFIGVGVGLILKRVLIKWGKD